MTVSYPKHPRDIPIHVTQRDIVEGMVCGAPANADTTLADKLDAYIMRLGYSSYHVAGIIVQLMTNAKVRVDFRDYTERLELGDEEDKVSSAQAMSMLEDFIAEKKIANEDDHKNITAKIIVQSSD